MNDKMLKITKAVCFTALFIAMMFLLTFVLKRKYSYTYDKDFYQEKQDYDILFTGISHMMDAVYPMELWKDYGIVSYNIGRPTNTLQVDYWRLRNMLDYSQPKLVVVDVRRTDIEVKELDYVENEGTVFDMIPFSANKVRAICDLYESVDRRIETLVPVLKYHERWKELDMNDFVPTYDALGKGVGLPMQYTLDAFVPKEYEQITNGSKVSGTELGISSLEKIITMCQERGIEVLLVELPYVANPTEQRLANSIEDIASKHNVNYVNFLRMDGIVDYETDFFDENGHMNDSGALKMTKYLGRYIMDNYDIEDHRGQQEYSSWDTDYKEYVLTNVERLNDMLNMRQEAIIAANINYDSIVYISEDAADELDHRMVKLINNIPVFDTDNIIIEESVQPGFYVISNSRGVIDYYSEADNEAIALNDALINYDSASGTVEVCSDSINYTYEDPKLFIALYDNVNSKLIHAAEFEIVSGDYKKAN